MTRGKVATCPAAQVWRAVRDAGSEGIGLAALRGLKDLANLDPGVIGHRVAMLKSQGHVAQPGGRLTPYLVNADCVVPIGYDVSFGAEPAAGEKARLGSVKVPTSQAAQIWRVVRNEGPAGIKRSELGKLPALSHIPPENLRTHLYTLKSGRYVAQVGGQGSSYVVDSSCLTPDGYDDGTALVPQVDRDDGLVVPNFLEQPTRLPASIAVMTSPRSRIWRCVRDAGRAGASRAHVIERLPDLALVVLLSQLAMLKREGFIVQPDGGNERFYVDADCRKPAGESPTLGPGWGDHVAGDNAEDSAPADAVPSAVLTSAPSIPASWIPLQVDAAPEGAIDQAPEEPAPTKSTADGWWADWPVPEALAKGNYGIDLGSEQRPAEAPAQPVADAPLGSVETSHDVLPEVTQVLNGGTLGWRTATFHLNAPKPQLFHASLDSDWRLHLQLTSGEMVAIDPDDTRKLLAFVGHITLPPQPSAQA